MNNLKDLQLSRNLKEGIDYFINEKGYLVFTGNYLLGRGFCCGNGCVHCPYEYENVPEPRRSALLTERANKPGSDDSEGNET